MSITRHPRIPVAYIIIIFLIVIGIILLVTLDSSSYKKRTIKTVGDLQKKLCVNRLHDKPVKPRPCPKNGIVSVEQYGKLANQIWEYATVWAVAKRTGLEPFLPRCIKNNLRKVFQNITMPSLDEISHCNIDINNYVTSIQDWSFNQSIIMEKWSNEEFLIASYANDLEEQFPYKPALIEKAENVFKNISGNKDIENFTFVGMHIRRTTYIRHIARSRGPMYLTNYFKSSMKYFENKYKNVWFIVVSEDVPWCNKFFAKYKNVVVTDLPTDQGMVLLSLCDHSVFDFGSFGTWAALYAGGETFFLDPKDTSYEVKPSASDLMRFWHKM